MLDIGADTLLELYSLSGNSWDESWRLFPATSVFRLGLKSWSIVETTRQNTMVKYQISRLRTQATIGGLCFFVAFFSVARSHSRK